jgi:DUF1365 family protein
MTELVEAKIFHGRVRPKRNAFSYVAYYVVLPLSRLRSEKGAALFSFEKFNLFSFRAADHGDGSSNPEGWMRNVLAQWNVPQADGEILLFTLPRVFGYVFNPVSFWFCFDRAGALRAVLAEVNNTFGERHYYLCCHEDRRPILADDWLETDKVFHVSPFMKVEGHYKFRFAIDLGRIAVRIDHHDQDGLMLSTAMGGKREPLSSARLAWCLVRYPLLSFKIIGLIHWQAVKLMVKGLRQNQKPAPPVTDISR